jgi:hypothetical protein
MTCGPARRFEQLRYECVCVCVHVYVYMCVYVYIYTYVYMNVYVYVYMECVYACVCARCLVYVRICVCGCARKACVWVFYVYVYVYVYVCMHVCVSVLKKTSSSNSWTKMHRFEVCCQEFHTKIHVNCFFRARKKTVIMKMRVNYKLLYMYGKRLSLNTSAAC